MRRGAALLFVCLLSSSCKKTPELVGRRYVVDAMHAAAVVGPELAKKPFTPEGSELDAFEAALPAFLRERRPEHRRKEAPLAERAPKYSRQFAGYVENDGTRVLWGNYFCSSGEGWDPTANRLRVHDGGDCYFQVEFLPATRAFRNLYVNGEG